MTETPTRDRPNMCFVNNIFCLQNHILCIYVNVCVFILSDIMKSEVRHILMIAMDHVRSPERRYQGPPLYQLYILIYEKSAGVLQT